MIFFGQFYHNNNIKNNKIDSIIIFRENIIIDSIIIFRENIIILLFF